MMNYVNKFGDPTYTDASPYEKVNAQWSLQFDVPFTKMVRNKIYVTATNTIGRWVIFLLISMSAYVGGFDFKFS